MSEDDDFYSTPEVAEMCGTSVAEARAFAEDAGLPRVGVAFVWTDADVEAFEDAADEDDEDDEDDEAENDLESAYLDGVEDGYDEAMTLDDDDDEDDDED